MSTAVMPERPTEATESAAVALEREMQQRFRFLIAKAFFGTGTLPNVGRIVLGRDCMGDECYDVNTGVRGCANVIRCHSAPEFLRLAAFRSLVGIAAALEQWEAKRELGGR